MWGGHDAGRCHVRSAKGAARTANHKETSAAHPFCAMSLKRTSSNYWQLKSRKILIRMTACLRRTSPRFRQASGPWPRCTGWTLASRSTPSKWPRLVEQTEAGLRELGLHELASCFAEAKELMLPLLAQRADADGDLVEVLDRAGLRARAEDVNRLAWALDNCGPGESLIYEAWIRYRANIRTVSSDPASLSHELDAKTPKTSIASVVPQARHATH